MNIVCNNCVGAWLYKLTDNKFNNPFIWSVIDIDDFILLVKNYNKINFKNVSFSLELYNKNVHKTVVATLNDFGLNIHYVHHIYDKLAVSPTIKSEINNIDLHFNDILKYSKNKYNIRIKRDNKEIPKFIYSFNYQYLLIDEKTYEERLKKLYELSKENKIYIICNKCDLSDKYILKQNDNFKLLQLSEEECKLYTTNDKEKIYNFIKEY